MSVRRAKSIQSSCLAVCAALAIVVTALPGRAELGGNVTSIENDQVHLQGSRRVIAAQSHTVHEIQAASGTVVREYVSLSGAVFAVTWHGPWLPDMRQLLGNYFETYRAAAESHSAAHIVRRPVTIHQPGLVVQIGGHLRAFSGRAYVPDMVPSGVRVEDLQ